jgi:glutathione S-transferase
MKLYEFAPTRSIRVRWTLQELAVDFEAIPVNMLAGEHRSPAFLKINPAGKLPVLVDGDMVLTESIAIVLYLAEKYRDKGLIPIDLQQRAQLMRWLLFTTTELEQPLWRIARHTTLYPESKRLPGELALARDDFSEMADVLEAYMSGDNSWWEIGRRWGTSCSPTPSTWRRRRRCSTGCHGSRRIWRRCTHGRVRPCASRRPSPASGDEQLSLHI